MTNKQTVADATTVVTKVNEIATSPALDALKLQRKEQWSTLRSIEDYESKEALEAKIALNVTDGKIKAEISRIENERRESEIAEKRAAVVKVVDDAINAAVSHALSQIEHNKLKGDAKVADIERSNNVYDIAKLAREAAVNQALSRSGLSARTSAPKIEGESTPREGGTGAKIRELLLAEIAAGQTNTNAVKNVIAAGFSRGTTGTEMTKLKNEGLAPSA